MAVSCLKPEVATADFSFLNAICGLHHESIDKDSTNTKTEGVDCMAMRDSNSPLHPKALPYLWGLTVFYLVLHSLVIRFTHEAYPSAFVVVGLGLLRIACCFWWFARLSSYPARLRWLAYACGAVLGNASIQIYAWREIFAPDHDYLSGTATLLTSLAAIPVLLSVSSNLKARDPRLVRWIDVVFSITLGCLFVLQIMAPGPANSASSVVRILSVNRLIDFESIFLTVCAALEFVSSESGEDRRFLYVFFCFMSVSTPVIAMRNRWAARYPNTLWDLVVDVPPLVFLLFALHPMPGWAYRFRAPRAIAHMVRGGSPLFMSLAITLLGITVLRYHFIGGVFGILLGIVGYGLRNAIIHGKLLETEDSLVVAKQELELQASLDGLTGISNRRVFDNTLKREWRAAIQTGNPFAVLMIDIDLFKGLNDFYGHQVGDGCLVAVATALQRMLPRAGDFVARYGGEEFAVILPGTSIAGAMAVAERLRLGVTELAIPHRQSPHGCVTISAGAAIGDAFSVPELSLLLKAADEALYRAKRAGRNRVEGVDLTVIRGSQQHV
jgi:diguanylate cyclase (GGDEF)-like protein